MARTPPHESAPGLNRNPGAHPRRRRGLGHRSTWTLVLALLLSGAGFAPVRGSAQIALPADSTTDTATRLLEFAGAVEVAPAGGDTWLPARPRQVVHVGDRIRTGPNARATLRLSDRSILRLDQRTLVEIRPPRTPTAFQRFRLGLGRLLFLDRERPADIEFETPLATGAIRGTEFVLEAAPEDGTTRLALLEGAVDLEHDGHSVSLAGGEQVLLRPGQPAARSPLVSAVAPVQWCLDYPAVLNPGDLALGPDEAAALGRSLVAWREGAFREALEVFPDALAQPSPAARAFRAGLALVLGHVDDARARLADLPSDDPPAKALRELVGAVVYGDHLSAGPPRTASEWLARSYLLQARFRLPEALGAARKATELAPEFGAAWIRVAHLEFAFERRRAAAVALARGLELSPRDPSAHALKGFVALAAARPRSARTAFERALELDPALAEAWLGLAFALGTQGHAADARRAFQVAAALEPARSALRGALGKAWSDSGDGHRASRELERAIELDPNDPTPWLYSALENHQARRPVEAIRDLERSLDLNDRRSIFRPRLLLDHDRSVRSADLAVLYDDLGLQRTASLTAARAVDEDYSNFSAHLFLARALQSREDPSRVDLRLETPRQNEWLLANLLAPPGAGNLSQQLSQQDHLRFLGPRPVAVSSLTEYASDGDWTQTASVFGSLGGLGYALDAQYLSWNGEAPNGDLERRQFSVQAKQRIAPDDDLYLQIGWLEADSGDVATHYDPADTDPDLRVEERQDPHLYLGWHHAWSPANHTLLLAGRLQDHLDLDDDARPVPFLFQTGGETVGIDTDRARYDLRQQSEFLLQSVELQQIWESPEHGVVAGLRYQSGDVATDATLAGPLPPPLTDQHAEGRLERGVGYARYQWRPVNSLSLAAGLAYDRVRYPRNLDLPPVDEGQDDRDLVAPTVGVTWFPFERTRLRSAYGQSLGGLYFDQSLRLEPTQLAGFPQAFRSLVPESVAGLVPGTRFESIAAGIDHTTPGGLYLGLDLEQLRSDGERWIGAVSNSLPVPLPDSPTQTRQSLDFEERSLTAYGHQRIGENWIVGADYRVAHAALETRFPDLPSTAAGLADLEVNEEALLHRVHLSLRFFHATGWFAEWHSSWYHQDNLGYSPARPDEDFWHHDVVGGYRFARRRAEIRLGILNLADTDYRLNPLNLHPSLPRERTFTAALRLNLP